jgi:PPM family protein phosphatase
LVSLKSWAESDIGRKRGTNEDSYFHDQDLGLFMVADGMGGHKGGDRASSIAIKVALSTFETKRSEHIPIDRALEIAFQRSAKEVFLQGLRNIELRGMGTTLSALAINSHCAHIAHIGDSRIYCFRNRSLHQVTSDHSFVNEQVQAGIMTLEEASISSLRNIITRAIGHKENVSADYFSILLEKNDIFILCTDGLNNMLLDSDIVRLLCRFEPKIAVRQLILEANLRGGEDNITVILVQVTS